jgi:hypothetical protein
LNDAHFRDSHDIIEFSIYPEGQRKICWISFEALSDHFGANRANAVQLLLQHMDRIAPVATRVAARTPAGDLILVKTSDF